MMKMISASALAAMLLAWPALADSRYDAPECGVEWDIVYPVCPPVRTVQWLENHPFAKGCLREHGLVYVERLECFERK